MLICLAQLRICLIKRVRSDRRDGRTDYVAQSALMKVLPDRCNLQNGLTWIFFLTWQNLMRSNVQKSAEPSRQLGI
jgi:hypothetical protein